jgi:hypothetical protein
MFELIDSAVGKQHRATSRTSLLVPIDVYETARGEMQISEWFRGTGTNIALVCCSLTLAN